MPGQKFTAEVLAHMATLARIELSDEEVFSLTRELEAMLSNFEKVGEVAVAEVAATSHPLPLFNVMREDEVRDVLTVEEALSNAPARQDDMFRVGSIVDEGV